MYMPGSAVTRHGVGASWSARSIGSRHRPVTRSASPIDVQFGQVLETARACRGAVRWISGSTPRSLHNAIAPASAAAEPIPTHSQAPPTETSAETSDGETIPAALQTSENKAKYRPRNASGARAVGTLPFNG